MNTKASSNTHCFVSFILTIVLSFATPIICSGAILAFLWLIGCIPPWNAIANEGIRQILIFLGTFSNGNPVTGSLIIGCAWGFVGGLFDLCTLYRYQNL